jgi:hypothetical protein
VNSEPIAGKSFCSCVLKSAGRCHPPEKDYSVRPVRVFAQAFLTSLNAPGFSITLFNATKAGGGESRDLLRFVDAPSDALGWSGGIHKSKPRPREQQYKKTPASADARAAKFEHDIKGELNPPPPNTSCASSLWAHVGILPSRSHPFGQGVAQGG